MWERSISDCVVWMVCGCTVASSYLKVKVDGHRRVCRQGSCIPPLNAPATEEASFHIHTVADGVKGAYITRTRQGGSQQRRRGVAYVESGRGRFVSTTVARPLIRRE